MKRLLKVMLLSSIVAGGFLGMKVTSVSAHGYVLEPVSRVKNANANGFNWGNIPWDQQAILNNPQGIENKTSKLDSSELNGVLASGGLAGYSLLNEQTSTRWTKSDIATGINNFTWEHTKPHKTNRYRYYMTKQGWNPNMPLSLENMDLIGIVGREIGNDFPVSEGWIPEIIDTHTITIPQDRKGYHVIFSVWDINDTVNSFFQAIDVNVN